MLGDGKQVKANILKKNSHPYPLIYLRGVSYNQLKFVLDFIYTGQESIVQEDLNQFLVIAEDLKVKGLFQTDLQTKSDRSAPLQSQDATEEAPPPLQEKVAVKEYSPLTSLIHPNSSISTHKALHFPSGILPQATCEQNNENTSNVKVKLLDAEHDNDSIKSNENDNTNKRRFPCWTKARKNMSQRKT